DRCGARAPRFWEAAAVGVLVGAPLADADFWVAAFLAAVFFVAVFWDVVLFWAAAGCAAENRNTTDATRESTSATVPTRITSNALQSNKDFGRAWRAEGWRSDWNSETDMSLELCFWRGYN